MERYFVWKDIFVVRVRMKIETKSLSKRTLNISFEMSLLQKRFNFCFNYH